MAKERIDIILVEGGWCETRSKARLLIKEGQVYYRGECIKKPGFLVDLDFDFSQKEAEFFLAQLPLEIKETFQYVGRGAYKLEAALKEFHVNPTGKVVADVGASTGGFTDCLLSLGAVRSYALDVGHQQLDPRLLRDERVINYEGVNIKYPFVLPEKVDLCVVDLSFISLRLVLKNIFDLLKEEGQVVALVKPQFEAGKGGGKKGIVRDQDKREGVLKDLLNWCYQNHFFVQDIGKSPIVGKQGNQEYFFHFLKSERQDLKKIFAETYDQKILRIQEVL